VISESTRICAPVCISGRVADLAVMESFLGCFL